MKEVLSVDTTMTTVSADAGRLKVVWIEREIRVLNAVTGEVLRTEKFGKFELEKFIERVKHFRKICNP